MITVVCIPAYNEEEIIDKVVKDCKRYCNEVLVCDDGSNDSTSNKAKVGGAQVIKHNKNLGKGAAMKSLFKFALQKNADVIVTIDGDGQFLAEDIPKLMSPVLEKKADIVIGYRFDNNQEMPTYRKIGNKFLDKVTNVASDLPFRDTQSGFRAYSKNAIEKIKFTTDGFGADAEILVNASKQGLKIKEEKVKVIYDTGGKTSTKDPLSHSSGVLASLLELIAIEHPLKYIGAPGLLLLILGIVYSIVVIGIFNETRYFSIPSTLVALGSLIIGLMLILMSVVLFAIQRIVIRKISEKN